MTDRRLLVYVDLDGAPHLVGRLWARSRKGRESATFEYEPSWIRFPARFALEPALVLGLGPQHTPAGRRLFGAIGDSAPDRWGRLLIQREERRKAREEKRNPRSLGEVDYLLGVDDIARQGALRFAEHDDGPFLATGAQIPPLVRLPALLTAAQGVRSRPRRTLGDCKISSARRPDIGHPVGSRGAHARRYGGNVHSGMAP
jgi:serine/threonine-protein kinase HipA